MRLIVDLKNGTRTVVPLTARELADAQARTAQEAARQAQEQTRLQAEQRRKNVLDQLAAKIEADPTILDRIV